MEHHSNIVPWQMLCEKTGATLKVIPIKENGSLNIDEYKSLQSAMDMQDIIKLTERLNMINKKVE